MNANPRKTTLSQAAFPIPHSALRTPHSKNRRGITLLFVMSMVVLFLLMGTTFVVVSNDYLRASARRNRNAGSVGGQAVSRAEGARLVKQSLYEALRGPNMDSVDSPLRNNDLLGDIYGHGIEAMVSSTTPPVKESEQFVELTIEFDYATATSSDGFPRSLLTGKRLLSLFRHDAEAKFPKPGGPPPPAEPQVPSHFNGRLLTVVSGDLKGLVTRIFNSNVAVSTALGTETHTFLVQPLAANQSFSVAGLAGQSVVINGRAFAGTGAGRFKEAATFDQPALTASAKEPFQKGKKLNDLVKDYLGRTPVGGGAPLPNDRAVNEPWDAVDMQNAFLAGIVDRTGGGGTAGKLEKDEITPSFGGTRNGTNYKKFDALEGIAAAGKLVDNDNDGIEDGLWMNTGLPVRSTTDGQFIKPLVSYLILDMDGRLNINAHGNLSEDDVLDLYPGGTSDLLTVGVQRENFSHGQGFGPAEVSLGALLEDQDTSTPENEIVEELVAARYRSSRSNQTETQAGLAGVDGRSRYRFTGYPADQAGGGLFGSPLDLLGRNGLGFFGDAARPLEAFMPTLAEFSGTPAPPIDDQLVDSPYELNLSGAWSSIDSLFSATELERLLRPQDRDTQLLDDRLVGNETDSVLRELYKSGSGFSDDKQRMLRKLLTTHSFEVPAIPADLNEQLFNALRLGAMSDEETADEMAILLSPEVRRGIPMNINRLFGDGRDQAPGNGTIDEPRENHDTIAGIGVDDPDTTARDESTEARLDVDGDGLADVAFSGLVARQNFARRLFVLMILLTEDPNGDGVINANGFYDFNGVGGKTLADLVAHRKLLAQWCANVVDFRDPDSIMTPIEFDLDPFGNNDPGDTSKVWEVDGNLFTNENDGSYTGTGVAPPTPTLTPFGGEETRFVVWGMERPELLISETTALHDRRLLDTDKDSSSNDTTSTPADPTLDSMFVPTASAFFELYNPWISRTNETPAELSVDTLNARGPGVDLFRRTGNFPVWRLLVVDPLGTTDGIDLRDKIDIEAIVDKAIAAEVAANAPTGDLISRYVYFVDPTAAVGQPFRGPKVYFPGPTAGPPQAVIRPGQYAVVGSGGVESGGLFTTYIGRRETDIIAANPETPPSELAQTQQIQLDPSSGTTSVDTGGGTFGDIAIAINRVADPGAGPSSQRSLGISDPYNGYYNLGTIVDTLDGQRFDDGAGGPLFLDEPADATKAEARAAGSWNMSPLNKNGLTTGYRVVFLQRLANPLLPHNAASNPYRIVDSSAIDLFAFNGVFDESSANVTQDPATPASLPESLGTFERGEKVGPAEHEKCVLWQTSLIGETDEPSTSADADVLTDHFLNRRFKNSLGKQNEFYEMNLTTKSDAFPWLTWNNRPFMNQYELANVPYASSASFARLFTIPEPGNPIDSFLVQNHEDAESRFPALQATPPPAFKEAFHPNAFGFLHLLNFHADSAESDRLASLMDFTEVPSRFAGAETYFNTEEIESVISGATTVERDELRRKLGYFPMAPFDELPNYRYPGKVNLNTIGSPEVWNALLGARSASAAPQKTDKAGLYAKGKLQGGAGLTYQEWAETGISKSPLRPAVAANAGSEDPSAPANAGLFRSTGLRPPNTPGSQAITDYIPAPISQNAYNNTDRNAYFRNSIRQRLGGVATNRSSVFAIWVTVGYFEWDQNTNNVRVDGGKAVEYGQDSGNVMRSRGFFLFDRSIPMAYEPGVNHNVDRGILLRSMID